MVIVKKDGRLEDFDSTKLIKSIGSKYTATKEYQNYKEQLGQAIEEESKWAWQKEIVRINLKFGRTG